MSQFNAPSYEIERPTGRCAISGNELAPGQPYVATLVEVNDETPQDEKSAATAKLGFRRLDIAWDVWQQGSRPEGLFCHWKTSVPEPHQKKKLFVDDDVLMNLFRRLADADQAERIAFRFVLGLILMRKKLLRYDGTQRRAGIDEQEGEVQQDWWQVTPKLDLSKGPLGRWNEDDRMEMLDPHLDEQQIAQVSEQLSEVLEAEL